ncbi:hypothetical protein [Arthrobacter mobilis]|uniref:Uncharacterized protein n=1 Tax=Arthrobacter mobilis TaxID=2724944 RepID=A0A7X6K6P5_9MICC|nr:hypothetical protein [Arthrobacter mobilis]NKX55715.1 hypothetical protein [Arthrobacter mobilis]
MAKNTWKTIVVALAAGAALVLGAGPAAARSSEGAWVDKSYGHYESNFVQTPSGNLMVQYNDHSGSGGGSDDSWSSSSHGQETMDEDGTKQSHFRFSYSGSGSRTDYSSHYAKDKVQYDRYESKSRKK